ncbi:MAG: hypothetical protein AAF208_02120 [Cyanobacteria bacterium P01_A01_bin.45]
MVFLMVFLKRLPWLSLGLVFLAYSILGWELSHGKLSPIMWLLSAIAILTMNILLNSPWSIIADSFDMLFKSDFRSFSVTVLGAFMFFAILAWFRSFLIIMLMLSTIILVRIDFQVEGLKEWQAFWVSATVSLLSLGTGALTYQAAYMIPLVISN